MNFIKLQKNIFSKIDDIIKLTEEAYQQVNDDASARSRLPMENHEAEYLNDIKDNISYVIFSYAKLNRFADDDTRAVFEETIKKTAQIMCKKVNLVTAQMALAEANSEEKEKLTLCFIRIKEVVDNISEAPDKPADKVFTSIMKEAIDSASQLVKTYSNDESKASFGFRNRIGSADKVKIASNLKQTMEAFNSAYSQVRPTADSTDKANKIFDMDNFFKSVANETVGDSAQDLRSRNGSFRPSAKTEKV